jgi:hypothetical protein
MPTEIPTLGEADLVAELEHIHRSPRRTRDTAFYGKGEAAAVRATLHDGAALYRVVPVRSELELRRALVAPRTEPLLALVSYEAAPLPLDLAARLARGEVCVVSSESRLRRHLGVRHVHPDVQRLRALCEALLVDEARPASPSGASSLDLDLAWRLLLASRCGLPRDVAFTLRRLLEHLAIASPAPRWIAWLRDNPELRPVFDGWLARTVDPIAPMLWALWEESLGRPVAALTFALGPLAARLGTDPIVRMQARGWLNDLSSRLGQAIGGDTAGLARWAAVEGGLRDGLRVSHGRTLDLLLRDADAIVTKFEVEPSVREALAASTSLSLAWDASLQRFAEALDACRAAPSPERYAAALVPFERLRAHRNADARSAVVDRARAALRLVAWRSARPDFTHVQTSGPPWQMAVELARDYVKHGGFVDLARRDVRGSDDGAFGRACVAVEADADALRDEDDARFAASLQRWVEAGRRGEHMVPIERALDAFGASFLEGGERRKLLVVLLDGASWANVTELLQDLDARHRHGVLRWQPTCNSASSFVAPVIAALPTITKVSRAAFFAGEVPSPGDRPDTGNDPVRFSKHARLRAVTDDVPKLHLEHDTPHVSEELRASVRSKKRVVGVVFNAIDDQLHGSRQVAVRYHTATIKPLAELLELARASGRAILFASDHGHVTGARLTSVASRRDDGEGRCRYLDEGVAPVDGELVFQGAGVWTPHKGQRLALRTRETDAMGSTRGDGLHGGATLAEVVAPTVLVASDGLAGDGDDRTLEVQSMPLPPWWDLAWKAPPARAATPEPTTVVQPTLPNVATAPVAPAAPVPTPAKIGGDYLPRTRLGRAVFDAPSFKALPPDRRRTLETLAVPIVDALVQHGGPMSSDMLARAIERFTWQARGLWPTASEILNIDGYPVLDFDERTGVVRLDVATLRLLLDLPETP